MKTSRRESVTHTVSDDLLPLPDDASIGLLLKLAHRLTHQHYSAALEAYKLTPTHIEVLRLLDQQQVCPIGELAERSRVTPPVMTAIIDTLAERGLVARHPDASDRRRHRLALTEHGRQLLAEVLAVRQKANDEIVAVLTVEEEAAMMSGLRKIIAKLMTITPRGSAPASQ